MATVMPVQSRLSSDREPITPRHERPGPLAPRDAQNLTPYPFFSRSKSHRTQPTDFVAGAVSTRIEPVPDHGMAMIRDAKILILAASQIVEARDNGLRIGLTTDGAAELYGHTGSIAIRRRQTVAESLSELLTRAVADTQGEPR